MAKKTIVKAHPSIKPVEKEVKNLLEMFEFYFTEREFGKSVEQLGESIKDMRHIIGRILIDHFLNLNSTQQKKFCSVMADMLADRASNLPIETPDNGDYTKYLIGEILTPFEYAMEIKEAHPKDFILQKILSLDIPILRPFDYGLRGKFRIISQKKKHIKIGVRP